MANNSKLTWIGIAAAAAIAVFLIARQFFPQIIEQIAAGILAFFVFLAGRIFGRKKSGS
jgi:hypothetical protein